MSDRGGHVNRGLGGGGHPHTSLRPETEEADVVGGAEAELGQKAVRGPEASTLLVTSGGSTIS